MVKIPGFADWFTEQLNSMREILYNLLPSGSVENVGSNLWDTITNTFNYIPFISLLKLSFGLFQFLTQVFVFFVIFVEAVICILSMTSGDWLRTWIHYNTLFFGALIRMTWSLIKYITTLLVEIVKFWA